MLDGLDEPHLFRLVVDYSQKDHGERFLHRGVLVQLVEDDLRFGATLQLDDDAHALARGFVADVGDVVYHFVGDQVGDALDELGFIYLIRDLGDDDGFASAGDVFSAGFGAHDEASAAVGIGLLNAALAVDDSGSREVGALDDLQKVFELRLRLVDQRDGRVHDLREIVRRDVGRHADGDPVRTIDQKIGDARRKNGRFLRALVVVRLEIYGVLINICEQLFGEALHAGFGVTHR